METCILRFHLKTFNERVPKKCWSAGKLLGVLSNRSGRDAGDLGTLVLLLLPALPDDLLDAEAGAG